MASSVKGSNSEPKLHGVDNRISPILPVEIWNIIIKYLETSSSYKHVIAFGQVSKECRSLCLSGSLLSRLSASIYKFLNLEPEKQNASRFEINHTYTHLATDKNARLYLALQNPASKDDEDGFLYILSPTSASQEVDSPEAVNPSVRSEIQGDFNLIRLHFVTDLENNKDKISYLINNSSRDKPSARYSFPEEQSLITAEHIKEWTSWGGIGCHPVENGFILVTGHGFGYWKFEKNQPVLQNFFCLFNYCKGGFSGILCSSLHKDLLILTYLTTEAYGILRQAEVLDIRQLLDSSSSSPLPQVLKSPFQKSEVVETSGVTLFERSSGYAGTIFYLECEEGPDGRTLKRTRKDLNKEEREAFQEEPQNWIGNHQLFHFTQRKEIVYLPTGTVCTRLFEQIPFSLSSKKWILPFINESETTFFICVQDTTFFTRSVPLLSINAETLNQKKP